MNKVMDCWLNKIYQQERAQTYFSPYGNGWREQATLDDSPLKSNQIGCHVMGSCFLQLCVSY